VAILRKGWKRLGLVLTVLWVGLVCAYALFDWHAPWYEKGAFFTVINRDVYYRTSGSVTPTVVFNNAKFFNVMLIPVGVLWMLISAVPAIKWVRAGFKESEAD
jgi:hypothetical protein